MVVGRVFRATGCPSCRTSIVRGFTSLSRPSIRTPPPSRRAQYPASSSSARFSSNVVQDGDVHGLVDQAGDRNITIEGTGRVENVEDAGDVKEVPPNEGSGEPSTVPWYLQADTPKIKAQPLSERQQIPELPELPPPILLPLLQRLSVDLGLDDLSLLDLRKLDPPPALGANLMMIVGTARSEKHLHVSADRLCRWLRGTYHLRPDADGLLGRNELKMKLRRKARRSKLLGSVTEDNEDDGVRTGWVCVDVGVVETAEQVTEGESDSKDFVGFGRRTDGVRIVVQMLTDEKREEIDLEGLWGGVLKRGLQRQIEASEGLDSGKLSSPAALPSTATRESSEPSSIPSGSRGFHTSAFRPSPQSEAQTTTRDSHVSNGLHAVPTSFKNSDLNDVRQYVIQSFASGNFQLTEASLLQFGNDILQLQNDGWRTFLLEQQRMYLESIPKDMAIGLLGAGYTDRTSTSFLASVYQTLPEFFSEADGKAMIDLYCYAMSIGHAGYTLDGLMELVSRLQIRGVAISRESYLELLRATLQDCHAENHSTVGTMRLLQAMYDQGHSVLTEEVFVVLQEALARDFGPDPTNTCASSPETLYLQGKEMSPRQRRLHVAMMAVDKLFFQDESRLRILGLYARQQHWLEFWDVWRMAPRHGKPQSPRMYAFMFTTLAATNDQKGCIEVLRVWVPEMDIESPKVLLQGGVAEAIRAALKVADPYVEEEATKDSKAHGEWIDLWRRTMH